MIENERQYHITRAQIERFEAALADLAQAPVPADVHPLLRKAELDGMRSQIASLQSQLADYDALRNGERTVLDLDSFEQLPQALIRARIVAGLSQEALGKRLGLKKQQIQHYESTRYASASFERLSEVVEALGIRFNAQLHQLSGDDQSLVLQPTTDMEE